MSFKADTPPKSIYPNSPHAPHEGVIVNQIQNMQDIEQHYDSPDRVLTSQLMCRCKNSKCLKLYCACFAQNALCGDQCVCVGCKNRDDNEERKRNLKRTRERNPKAFDKRILVTTSDEGIVFENAAGCSCKKSRCLKKYCECYRNGLQCGAHCACVNCLNCAALFQDFSPSSSILSTFPE